MKKLFNAFLFLKVAQGAVVINSGSTTIKASRGVTITKDFEVGLGAEFTITNE